MKKAVLREYLKNRETKWAVTEEKDGIHVRPVVDGEIIDTPVEKVIKPKRTKKGDK